MNFNPEYQITIDINVLNHLGINLYSNIPAVLSEVVANSWDADAKNVQITSGNGTITIEDDGCGMTRDEINEKYLKVGYQRRTKPEGDKTPSGRPIMGRKGIGKLSLFSIANVIEVVSRRNAQKSGCILNVEDIKKSIASRKNKTYYPAPISQDRIDLQEDGTRITISELKRDFNRTAIYLKKRIARRFSILGEKWNFKVTINGELVSVEDRDYFQRIQFLLCYGNESDLERLLKYCKKVEFDDFKESWIEVDGVQYPIKGWLGTVRKSTDLKDEDENLNKIIIMARGKLAQEDILAEFGEGGVYARYVIGEINADFLDLTDLDDIATTSRQEIIAEDPRYKALKKWLWYELKKIESIWDKYRGEVGTKKALEIAPIKKWFDELGPDQQKYAKIIFAKIEKMGIDDLDAKKALYKYGIIAFESLWARENLNKLETVSMENFQDFIKLFDTLEDIEAAQY